MVGYMVRLGIKPLMYLIKRWIVRLLVVLAFASGAWAHAQGFEHRTQMYGLTFGEPLQMARCSESVLRDLSVYEGPVCYIEDKPVENSGRGVAGKFATIVFPVSRAPQGSVSNVLSAQLIDGKLESLVVFTDGTDMQAQSKVVSMLRAKFGQPEDERKMADDEDDFLRANAVPGSLFAMWTSGSVSVLFWGIAKEYEQIKMGKIVLFTSTLDDTLWNFDHTEEVPMWDDEPAAK